MTTFVCYHSADYDGKASAAIAKYFLQDVDLIPYDYHLPFPFGAIQMGDSVYFLDVTMNPYDDLLKVVDIIGGENLTIIDHHKTFWESGIILHLEARGVKVVYDDKRAGCELTWEYFSNRQESLIRDLNNMSEDMEFINPMPRAIHLLGQYDSWRNTKERLLHGDFEWDEVLSFQYGMRRRDFNMDLFINNFIKEDGYPDDLDRVLREGKLILEYQRDQSRAAMNNSFTANISGFRCLCLNIGGANSTVFESKWDPEIWDAMVAFVYTKQGKWKWSFYTDKPGIDVSDLARQYGGGGHRQASGCVTDELIFMRKVSE